ncbi:MAG: DUF5819 family protein [Myxococcota bacterium]
MKQRAIDLPNENTEALTRDRSVLRVAIVVGTPLFALFLFHFTAVLLYVSPPNLVSLSSRPWVESYIDPIFSQRWELFAPEPGGRNQRLHIQCHGEADGETWSSDWIDITTPIVRAKRVNRLGPAARMLRASSPRMLPDQRHERRILKKLEGPLAERALAALNQQSKKAFDDGLLHMQRLASAECKRRFTEQDYVLRRVEVRQLVEWVRPYGKRHEPRSEPVSAFALAPMPYVDVDL